MDYAIVFGVLLLGCAALMSVMYFSYRRGVAIRIGLLVSLTALCVGSACYMIGKEGLTFLRVVISFIAVVPIVIGVVLWGVKTIVNPARQIEKAAESLLLGDLKQEIVVLSNDEMGDVSKAFGQICAYLQELAAAAAALAEGDLSQRIQPRSERDILGNSFARMTTNLRDLVNQVAQNATTINEFSAQVSISAAQSGQVVSQIAATIQQVAQGTTQQSESVSRTVTSVTQVSRAIDGVASGAQEQASAVVTTSSVTSQISSAIQQVSQRAELQAKSSAEAVQTTQSSARVVDETVKAMEKIKTKVDVSVQKVQEMGQHSAQIGTIVGTIDDIASQTNLLALNAAIEAARAGESGRGFAVVADEVRKLAEKSATATKEIAGLIKGIQRTVGEAVQVMNESAGEVDHGVRLAGQSKKALDELLASARESQKSGEQIAAAAGKMTTLAGELVGAMDTVSSIVEENSAATEEMAAGSEDVLQAVQNIASVSEENSATLEEVSASTVEMREQVEEVTASVQFLSESAKTLQELVNRFRLC